ncbi:hypothetical protein [Massilia sp. erpn]|uniref:hypothetical protein n=1 Tax=Massilia sp. erpn TaxID=2738142 RepID=UPI0021040305|nr:hypothetical protein [Massilia sp. erpn]UTY58392.1 hypothetical protein HPQ68_15085 [Massilia sp. erpn]
MILDTPKAQPVKPSIDRQLSAESLTPPDQTGLTFEAANLAERRSSVLKAFAIERPSGEAVAATVTGTTHAVGIKNKMREIDNKEVPVTSLFDGNELKEAYVTGSKVEIDPMHSIVSRRGPHQEVMGVHKQDSNAVAEHVWYPVHSKDSSDYKKDGWPYIRSDTLVEKDALAASADSLRKRAAPTHEYEKIGDLGVAKFIEKQKDYQAKLLNGKCTKEQILLSHRSVGFEYEFIGHSMKELPSHVKLAKSESYSDLFKMPFELESDSGDVVEIVMPPFIVPNLPDGGPDQEEIHAIYVEMEKAVAEVRDEVIKKGGEGVKLSDFIEELNKKGLGQGWELSKESGDVPSEMNIKESDAEKFKGGRIYSQMNISLDGDESARLINIIHKKFDPGTAEKTIIGETYNALEGKIPKDVEGGHYIHLIKTMASSLAIPSILLQKERVEVSRDDDLSSTVKELLGTWVKDSMPNILKTTSASRDDLIKLKDFAENEAKPIILESFEKLKGGLEYYHPRKNEYEEWGKFKKEVAERNEQMAVSESELGEIDEEKYAAIRESDEFRKCTKMTEWLGSSVIGDVFYLDGEKVESGHAEFKNMENKYNKYYGKLDLKINNKLDALDERKIFNTIWDTFNDEISNIIDKIDTPEVVTVERTDFKNEKFRKGEVGVRKDTYILPDPNSIMSVVELRSDAIINAFKNANLKG